MATIMHMRIVHYVTNEGVDYFDRWMRRQTPYLRSRVQTRIDRIELGNFGDHRSLGTGIYELRLNFGAGYRIYYGRDGYDIVVLLVAGAKNRQSRDISLAKSCWGAYLQEKRHAN